MRIRRKIIAGILAASMAATAGTVPSGVHAAENPADEDERIVVSLDFDDESIGNASAVTKSWADYAGDITYAEGRTGKALQLSGYGLRLNQKNVGANYTVSMWMKHDNVLAENQQILFLGHGDGSSENWLDIGGDRGSNSTYEIWTRNTTPSSEISGWNYLDESVSQITGEWVMLTVTGDGNSFRAYVNGQQVELSGGGMTDASIRNAANVLNGEDQDIYVGVNYWDTAFSGLVDDIVVYGDDLSAEEISALYEQQYTEYVAEHLSLGDLTSVSEDLTLPVSDADGKVSIAWSSDHEDIISNDGTVTRPQTDKDAEVTLTAIFTYGSAEIKKEYTVTVKREDTAADLEEAADALTLCTVTAEDLNLPSEGEKGTAITWSSSDPEVMTDDGKIVSRPAAGEGNAVITLTASISKNDVEITKDFEVEVLEEYYGYIYGYITGDNDRTGSLHLAYSTDGENYTALNSNAGIHFAKIDTNDGTKDLSTGIRFTEISLFRKADGSFGMAAPQGKDQRQVYIYDSEDLLTYGGERLIATNSNLGNVSDVAVKYDASVGGYYLCWTAGASQYANVTTDLQTFGAAEKAEYSRDELNADTKVPDGAKNGSVIGVTKDEYETIINHFAMAAYVSTEQPEKITVDTAADVEDALPDTVSVSYDDGSASAMNVTWDVDSPDFSKAGTYTVTGTLSSYENPLIEERADPQIMYDETDKCYYFTASYPAYGNVNNGYDRIILRRADTISGLSDDDTEVTIWKAPSSGQMAKHVWAPELHKVDGRWYVFFAAGNSDNIWAIRPYVLVCQGDDPYDPDNWVQEDGTAEIHAATSEDSAYFQHMSLDMTYFTDEDSDGTTHHYVIWADIIGQSALYMQEIDPGRPWAGTGKVIQLTTPEYGWERDSERVNEGPAILKHDGRIFCTFSASGTGPEYCIGLLYADEDSDLMDPDSWTKLSYPILTSEDVPGEYGPGHNSFTVDADGNPVFVYHARSEECYLDQCEYASSDPLYDPCRHARVKNVHWSRDGLPILKMSAGEELPEGTEKVTIQVTVREDSEVVRNLSDAVISGVENTVETGNQIRPDISVSWGTAVLKEGTDYTVDYGQNILAGEGSVTITAVEGGRYTGEQTVTFRILPYLIADFTFDDPENGLQGGNAVAAAAGGNIDYVEHDGGYAAQFNAGDQDYLNVTAADGSSLLTGYDEISISYDLLVPDTSGTNWVYYIAPDDTSLTWNTNGNREQYLGVLIKDGNLEAERYNNNGSRPANPSASVKEGTWMHVDIVYARDCTQVYVDGELKSQADTNYQLTDILGDESIFQIGKANWAPGEYSTMTLDNFRIVAGNVTEEPEEPIELQILSDPENYAGAKGETAVFEIKAVGTGLNYQWQYCNASSNIWRDSSMKGSSTSRLSVEVAGYRDGQKYRCVVTDAEGNTAVSGTAVITVAEPEAPVITGQPEDYTGSVGETAQFTVQASGTGLTYKWQYCNASSNIWRDSSMPGSGTETISVPIANSRDGQKYRCVVTGENGGSVISRVVYLTVGIAEGTPEITVQPEDFKGVVGETAQFMVQASGTGLTYKWQYCNAGSNVWRGSSMKGNGSASLSVPVTAARDGQKYRCVITGENGRSVITEEAVLYCVQQ